MLSMPPQSTMSAWPHWISWAAKVTAFIPAGQALLMVTPGTCSPAPPRSAAVRAGLT